MDPEKGALGAFHQLLNELHQLVAFSYRIIVMHGFTHDYS